MAESINGLGSRLGLKPRGSKVEGRRSKVEGRRSKVPARNLPRRKLPEEGACRRPRLLLVIEEAAEQARARATFGAAGLDVDIVSDVSSVACCPFPPDLVVVQRSFAGGHGSVAICLVRPEGPPDALRVLAEVAQGQERLLAERLGVNADDVTRRLLDLVPVIATFASTCDKRPAAPRARLRAAQLVEEMEDCLIRLMLASTKSDHQAAEWLGYKDGTLRSKMRKRQIPSHRKGRG